MYRTIRATEFQSEIWEKWKKKSKIIAAAAGEKANAENRKLIASHRGFVARERNVWFTAAGAVL